jgi:serine/threonine protein kinase
MPDDDAKKMAEARLGRVLRGKYRLDRVIGIGGMATVYAATHRNKKKFAIKMLHAELSMRDNIRTRFLREGYVANSVEHAGAVAVLDDDVAEDGSAFIVMDLLRGATLDEVASRHGGVLPLPVVLSIGDALLDVLAAAHAKGIVHRDIKPANVFLTGDGRLQVLDFGIARLHDASGGEATATGVMLGTPAYMAPEQALAETAKIDAQTDLWAVGATLFVLLTGHLVHEGDNASKLMVSAATKKARSIMSLAHDLPRAVAEVIDRALAFDKAERWPSAQAMRDALAKACLEATGEPVAALPKTTADADKPMITLEETATSGSDASPASRIGFEPTVDAVSGVAGGSAGTRPSQTTGAPLSRGKPAASTPPRRMVPWRGVALGVVALAAVGGGAFAFRAARAPRVRYCQATQPTNDGPRCLFEVGADFIGKRGSVLSRFTERSGRVVSIESINFAGLPDDPDSNDEEHGFARLEVLRDDAGAVRETVSYNRAGVEIERQKWSEGGRRIDFVDVDGTAPRHLYDLAGGPTTWRVDYDAQGRATRIRFLGPTGRPRPLEGVYGQEFEYGTSGLPRRLTFLGADGTPAPLAEGATTIQLQDGGSPWPDKSFFDGQGQPITLAGTHTLHPLHNDYESIGFSCLGLHGEATTNLNGTFHEARHLWDPVKHAREWLIFDEQGHPQLVRGQWFLALRQSFDARGNRVLDEFLDAQGNRVVIKNGESADRYAYDEHDHRIRIESLDTSGALMQGANAFARRDATVDAHGNALEYRYYDEAGRLAPWKDGGAIRRGTFDERGLRLTDAHLDADAHPVANVHGVSSEHRKFDRLRNRVEVAYFGPDGKPTVSDEGFAVERVTYDDNDDVVAVSYFDANGAPTLYKSAYATRRVVNDERGLVIEESYLDVHGDPILIKDGYASKKMMRDRNGDVVEETFFGKHGEPVQREGGFALRKTTWNGTRKPVEVALFDASGQPVRGSAGWAIERTTYDERGLVVRIDHLDIAKAPALDRDGRASIARSYDSRGNVIEEKSLDAPGNPVVTSDGYATRKTTYDERDDILEEALLDAAGKPVAGKAGWSLRRARYDDWGNQIEESFFDGTREPVTPKDLPYSSRQQRFDERHRLAQSAYFDERGAPTKGPDGAAVVRTKRDGYGRAIETSYLDGTGAPAPSKDGRVVVRAQYDDGGHLVDERFVDGSGAPRPAADGCSGHHTRYDNLGRKLEEACLDGKEAPTAGTDGWALRRTLHDARGNDVETSTYAPDGTLHADKDGIARRKNRFDDRGLLIETTFFDAADKPAHDHRGAHAVRLSYDDTGKKTGESLFDEHDRPVAAKK